MMAPENCQTIGKMADVHVSSLVGSALDWAVAKVEGLPALIYPCEPPYVYIDLPGRGCGPYHPSHYWLDGGPLIEKYGLSLLAPEEGFSQWSVVKEWCHGDIESTYPESPTALIAACRAIVAAHLGEVVSVPAELVEQISA